MKLRIATRRSALALTQTRWFASQLQAARASLTVELVEMVTQGDRIQDRSLAEIGGKGLFVSEIEEAIRDGRADLAVLSLKDVPAELAEGLTLACVPEREDPRDALVTTDGAELDDLEAGSRVGTNSLRRSLQLGARRNDLHYDMLRGNVDTRLGKLEQGDYRAILLACSGLKRLGLFERPLQALPVEHCLPAVGQGALAVEARGDDAATLELLARVEHGPSRICVEAERSFLRCLGGDCTTPLAGHAQLLDGGTRLRFDGWVASPDGASELRGGGDRIEPAGLDATRARQLGQEVAEELLARGAAELIGTRDAARDPREKPGG